MFYSTRSLLILVLGLLLAGCLVAVGARGAGPLPGDLPLTLALQRAPFLASSTAEGLAAVELAVLFLPLVVVPVMLATRRWLAAVLVLLAALGGLLGGEIVLKRLVARPRPDATLVAVHEPSTSFGFPSSTTMLALAVLGITGVVLGEALAPSRPRLAGAIPSLVVLVALLIGLSRVVLGAHWPSDIAGSLLFGGAWLSLLAAAYRAWRARAASHPATSARREREHGHTTH